MNELIFKDISPFLIYNSSFENILGYFLLSKSCFKLFQYLLPKYYVFDFEILKNYILNSNEEHYNLKVIQYKDIETIKIENTYSSDMDADFELFNEYCPKLNLVYYMDYLVPSPPPIYIIINNEEFNPCYNGYFVFNRCEVRMDDHNIFPISNSRELIETRQLNIEQLFNYQFSFNYLEHYRPKRILIKNGSFKGISNLTLLSSINSIKFAYGHESTFQFLKLSLLNPNIRSVSLNLNLNHSIDFDNIFEYSSNSKLRKLCLYSTNNNNNNNSSIIDFHLQSLFRNLKRLKYLTSLSLDLFPSQNPQLFNQLLEFKNINTIHIRIFDNFNLNLFNHILVNPNISKLVVHFVSSFKNTILQILNSLNNLHKTLILKMYFNQDQYEQNQQDYLEIKQIINQLSNSNYNIIFKKR